MLFGAVDRVRTMAMVVFPPVWKHLLASLILLMLAFAHPILAQQAVDPTDWAIVEVWEGTIRQLVTSRADSPGGKSVGRRAVEARLRLRLTRTGPDPQWEGDVNLIASYDEESSSANSSSRTHAAGAGPVRVRLVIKRAYALIASEGLPISGTTTTSSPAISAPFSYIVPVFMSLPFAKLPHSIEDVVYNEKYVRGSTTVETNWLLKPVLLSKYKSIKVWVNAFIPKEIPNLTRPVSGTGPNAGLTMVPGPPLISGCFLTDQRWFSELIDDSSRIHHELKIDLVKGVLIGEPYKHSFPTVELDCQTGDERCRKTATATMQEKPMIKASFDGRGPGSAEITFYLNGTASNPCITGSPAITYNLTVVISIDSGRQTGSISYFGETTRFPAFESYYTLNDGPTRILFLQPQELGSRPESLFFPPQQVQGGRQAF